MSCYRGQHPASKASLLAESQSSDASVIAPVVRGLVRKLDRDMAVFDRPSIKDLYDQRAIKTSNLIFSARWRNGSDRRMILASL